MFLAAGAVATAESACFVCGTACCLGSACTRCFTPMASGGRKASLGITIVALGLAVAAQNEGYAYVSFWLKPQWTCEPTPECYQESAVLRVAYAAILFFLLQALFCRLQPGFIDAVS